MFRLEEEVMETDPFGWKFIIYTRGYDRACRIFSRSKFKWGKRYDWETSYAYESRSLIHVGPAPFRIRTV
jgi:hypothetical protein